MKGPASTPPLRQFRRGELRKKHMKMTDTQTAAGIPAADHITEEFAHNAWHIAILGDGSYIATRHDPAGDLETRGSGKTVTELREFLDSVDSCPEPVLATPELVAEHMEALKAEEAVYAERLEELMNEAFGQEEEAA